MEQTHGEKARAAEGRAADHANKGDFAKARAEWTAASHHWRNAADHAAQTGDTIASAILTDEARRTDRKANEE